MAEENKAVHVIISGMVQGVGFRWFVERIAKNLKLSGLVRNLPDGTVETLAEGDGGALNAFVDQLWIGPVNSRVTDVKATEKDFNNEFKDFRIVQ
jgi:acylphosphatase